MRSGTAVIWIVALAIVGPWFGAASVCPSTISTRSNATSSSSATICASAVRTPVPRSTCPLNACTRPSARTAMNTSGVAGT
ncbi:Uncharacterised protein [Bordetella pertussis]|nr:hypothetical protein [Bordetella bronchiseptica]CFM02516.1 Uncharacterised protein [Bordetella pertussis]CFM50855.1 Uncharacterised protein [Bordetella pertussis]CFM84437.1 Uncharacterised protein [Bordetella pertussis]CFN29832.1 Uncharacterised protein [Bordetella pertussis]